MKSCIFTIACLFLFGCDADLVNNATEPDGRITAAYYKAEVDSLAKGKGNDLKLISISSNNVNADGTAALWCYTYVGTVPPLALSEYCFHATCADVAFDSTSTLKCGSGVIQHNWLNSA